jgi:CubicO group peptidase (beta-lactamase class C family)
VRLTRRALLTSAASSFAAAACARGRSSTPPERGIEPGVLAQAARFVATENKELHSLLIVRNGQIVSETYWPPYERNQKHVLNSCTKAVVSALIGIASDDGVLRESDALLGYFADQTPANLDDAKKAITIKHLLTMSSGISWPQYGPDNISDKMGRSPVWVKFILDRPMAAAPGTVTNYSNGDSHLLSAIIGKVTRSTALEFGRERLFRPLGISDVHWESDPQGRSIGSAALYMKPLDMTKLGGLYLANGVWNGQRILSVDWVKKSLTAQTQMPTKGGAAGYGYYWWLYPERKLFEAWGGAGQRIGIFPELAVVVVMTAAIGDDFPRSPFAAKLYDYALQATK